MAKKLKVIPLNDRIYIQPFGEDDYEKTGGGLIISVQANDNVSFGRVVRVGTGRVVNGALVPFSVKEGDEIAYIKRATTEYTRQGTQVLIKESDILSIHEYEDDGK